MSRNGRLSAEILMMIIQLDSFENDYLYTKSVKFTWNSNGSFKSMMYIDKTSASS